MELKMFGSYGLNLKLQLIVLTYALQYFKAVFITKCVLFVLGFGALSQLPKLA